MLGPWLPKLLFGLGLVPRLCIFVVVELLCHLNNVLGYCFTKLWFGLGLVLELVPKLVFVVGNLVPQFVCLGWAWLCVWFLSWYVAVGGLGSLSRLFWLGLLLCLVPKLLFVVGGLVP